MPPRTQHRHAPCLTCGIYTSHSTGFCSEACWQKAEAERHCYQASSHGEVIAQKSIGQVAETVKHFMGWLTSDADNGEDYLRDNLPEVAQARDQYLAKVRMGATRARATDAKLCLDPCPRNYGLCELPKEHRGPHKLGPELWYTPGAPPAPPPPSPGPARAAQHMTGALPQKATVADAHCVTCDGYGAVLDAFPDGKTRPIPCPSCKGARTR